MPSSFEDLQGRSERAAKLARLLKEPALGREKTELIGRRSPGQHCEQLFFFETATCVSQSLVPHSVLAREAPSSEPWVRLIFSLFENGRRVVLAALQNQSREQSLSSSPPRLPSFERSRSTRRGRFSSSRKHDFNASETSRRPSCHQHDAEREAQSEGSLFSRKERSPREGIHLDRVSLSTSFFFSVLNLLLLLFSLSHSKTKTQASPSSTAGSPSATRSSTSPSWARTSRRSTPFTST